MDPPAPEPRVPPDDAFCEMLAAYDEQLAQGPMPLPNAP